MSARLPPALAPWTTSLSLLHSEVIHGLGPWLAPFQQLIGSLALPRATQTGDPDGLSGLTRRGPYDRLVLSEWVVALELPDEFVRRAVMGEHVFSSPAFRQPHGARTSVALLDAGPLQFGAPRLVQLAALVVLAQRATDSGAEFRFGALQDPSQTLFTVDRAGLLRWAALRFAATAPADPDAWRAALADLDARDVWVVGADALQAVAGELRAGFISVAEPLVANARRLDVTVHRPSAPGGHVSLALPDERACLRTLRHPVGTVVLNPTSLDISDTGLGWLSVRGDRVIFAARSRHPFVAIHLPVRPDAARGADRRITDEIEETPVAIDVVGKRPVVLFVDRDRQLVLGGSGVGQGSAGHSTSTLYRLDVDAPPTLHASRQEARPQLFVGRTDTTGLLAWIFDGQGSLYKLVAQHAGTHKLISVDHGCARLTRYSASQLVWISRSQASILSSTGFNTPPPHIDPDALGSVVFGPQFHGTRHVPSFAVRRSPDTLEVFEMRPEPFMVSVPPRCEVIGLSTYVDNERVIQPQPLVLSEDKRSVRIPTAAGKQVLALPGPLASSRWTPCHGTLIWQTEAGHVGIDSFDPMRVRLRLEPTGTCGASEGPS